MVAPRKEPQHAPVDERSFVPEPPRAVGGKAPEPRPVIFRNFGGMKQLMVLDADDLAQVSELDAARWAATSAPVRDLHCDAGFLAYLDPEKHGRIRVGQLLAARDWLFARLKNRSHLAERTETLILADVEGTSTDGKRLLQAAERILGHLGATARDRIALNDVRAYKASYAQALVNGDGIVPPELVTEAEVAAFAKDVLAIVPGATDASGKPGVGQPELDKFIAQGKAYLAWRDRSKDHPELLPWGPETAGAVAALDAVAAKVDEFYLQCDLLRVESSSAARLRMSEEGWKGFKAREAAAVQKYLAESPLATPSSEGLLPLDGSDVNAVYADALAAVKKLAARALGKDVASLDRATWKQLWSTFDAYRAWQKEKPAEPFEKLPAGQLEKDLASNLPEKLSALIALDLAAKPDVEMVADLEKLVLYQRWLLELANNFVNFSAIYHPKQTALVEMGSLVIDGRRLDFCLKVEDRAAHKKTAAESLIYLVYASVTGQDGTTPAYEIAAPVTGGERGRLRVGKRGIFIDTAGKEWDAVVVDIVENPISLIEAIRAPFRRASEFISKRVEEMAKSKLESQEKKLQQELASSTDKAAEQAVQSAEAKTVVIVSQQQPAPADAKKPAGGDLSMRDLLLGGGIAFAAVGSAFAYIVSALSHVNALNAFMAFTVVVGGIAALSAFLGWLKLRRRDLAWVLEANGWAVNAEMRLNRKIGRVFTNVPPLPPGTIVDNTDLTASPEERARVLRRRRVRRLVMFLVVAAAAAVLWRYGYLQMPRLK